jgi:hypothetical protein
MTSCVTDAFSMTAPGAKGVRTLRQECQNNGHWIYSNLPMIVMMLGCRSVDNVFISSMKLVLVHDRSFLKDDEDLGAVGSVRSEKSKWLSVDADTLRNSVDCTMDISMLISRSWSPSLDSVSVGPLLVDNPCSTSRPGALSGGGAAFFSSRSRRLLVALGIPLTSESRWVCSFYCYFGPTEFCLKHDTKTSMSNDHTRGGKVQFIGFHEPQTIRLFFFSFQVPLHGN